MAAEKGKNLLDKILHPAKHKEEKARRASAGSAEGGGSSSGGSGSGEAKPTATTAAEQHVEAAPPMEHAGDHAKHSESEVKKLEEYVHKDAAKEANDDIWGQPGR